MLSNLDVTNNVFANFCSPLTGGTVGKEHWDVKQYYCTKMSDAIFPVLGGKSMFPPSTEAFVVVEYDNNFGRWTNTVNFYQQKGNNFKTTLPPKKDKEQKEAADYKGDPLHDGKYTSSSSGQKRFGTYSVLGLEVFAKFQKILKQNAKQNAKAIEQFETKFLEKLKVEDAIGDDGLPTNKKNGKKRKIPGDGPKKRQKVTISTDSDDEDAPTLAAISQDASDSGNDDEHASDDDSDNESFSGLLG